MPPIQVVLFDLGGTLLHYDQPPEFSMDALNAAALRAFLAAAVQAGGKVPDPELAVRAVGGMAAALEAKAAAHATMPTRPRISSRRVCRRSTFVCQTMPGMPVWPLTTAPSQQSQNRSKEILRECWLS